MSTTSIDDTPRSRHIPPRETEDVFVGIVRSIRHHLEALDHIGYMTSYRELRELAEIMDERTSIGWVSQQMLDESMGAAEDIGANVLSWTPREILKVLDAFLIFEQGTIPGRFSFDNPRGEMEIRAVGWVYDNDDETFSFQFYSDTSHGQTTPFVDGDFQMVGYIEIPADLAMSQGNIEQQFRLSGFPEESLPYYSSLLSTMLCLFVISESGTSTSSLARINKTRSSGGGRGPSRPRYIIRYIGLADSNHTSESRGEGRKRGLDFQWRVRAHFRRNSKSGGYSYVRSHLKGEPGTMILRDRRLTWVWVK